MTPGVTIRCDYATSSSMACFMARLARISRLEQDVSTDLIWVITAMANFTGADVTERPS